MLNALTIDVEDWFHATYLGVPEEAWPDCEGRVLSNTQRILDLLSGAGVRATFFVLGCVAESTPEIVRRIAEGGHEIACHSYRHRRVCRQTPAEFAADLQRSVEQISRVTGAPVSGYRAPAFSIDLDKSWVFDILADNGFLYDSSILPVRTPLYGAAGTPRFSYRIGDGRLLEIPLSTTQIGRWRFPIAGGVYLRLLPFRLISWAIRRLNQVDCRPAVIYLHPWELDPMPPPRGRNTLARWSHTVNKGAMEQRVRRLLTSFAFAPIQDVFSINKVPTGEDQL